MTTTTAMPSLVVTDVPIDDLHPDPANLSHILEEELESLRRTARWR